MRQLLRIYLLLLCFSGNVFALGIETPLSDSALETRAKTLFRDIRCVVCQGESIADSPSQIAGDMRRAIREKVAAGDSDADITSELVSHYGNVVLMKPPFNPATYVLWFGPLLILFYAIRMAYGLFNQPEKSKNP